jgi:hypothetical protein
LEPHSFESLPTEIRNVLLMSFHAESEVVVNYAYSVMHNFGLCVVDEPGTRDNGDKCENMRARDSQFIVGAQARTVIYELVSST